MSEGDVAHSTEYPLTIGLLADQLRACGLAQGQNVLVHMAMSKLGYVIGGAQAVIMAFLDVLGPDGTLMMVTNSSNNTDPSEWQHPPVPESWWPLFREHAPAYDPATTPTRGMGAVPELFRTWPGTIRSGHPAFSLAARGPQAAFLTADHALEEDSGERSPLARLYDLDGYVLLLGVEHWNNTSLHLAEFRANYPGKHNLHTGSPVLVNGVRQWVEYETLNTDADDFGEIGDAFDAAHNVQIHKVGNADARFFKQRAVVDFAVNWMERHRDQT